MVFIRERDVERALVAQVRKTGGMCLKFVSPGWSGAPDRICLFPGGKMAFVELKAPGKRARPLQVKRHSQLKALGFEVNVIDGKEGIDRLIAKYGGGDGASAGATPQLPEVCC